MKRFFCAIGMCAGLVGLAPAQECTPRAMDCCPVVTHCATSTMCCAWIQETTATTTVEPVSVMIQEPAQAEPSSVLASPAPEPQLTTGEPSPDSVRTSSRRSSGNGAVRRRGVIMGRLFNRFR